LLEPQSAGLFVVLMLAFCGLLVWVAVAKQPAFRVLAASLAFVPAMLFGVAAVNKYYDYYQTWSAIAADVGAQGVGPSAQVTGGVSGQGRPGILGSVTAGMRAARQGETVRLTVTGQHSHVRRTVYVYLPPQYFQPAYRRYRFPAIELVSGFPGQPQDWINVVEITQTYLTLLRGGLVKPVALVMPDPNGSPQGSLQCLNMLHGPQDATFMAVDVPLAMAGSLRLRGSGPDWGIAGYSEGGFCAANLALVYPSRYGYAGVLSGYFKPSSDRLGSPPRIVRPFGRDARLKRVNTPLHEVRALSLAVHIPWFWLGAGSADAQDVKAARAFQRALLFRQPNAQIHLAPGGAHNMATWRALVPPLLEWMTPRLAAAARHAPARPGHPGQPPPQRAGAGTPPLGKTPPASRAPVPAQARTGPHGQRSRHAREARAPLGHGLSAAWSRGSGTAS
jgi:enterochelin esterase-like enzyme